MNRVLFFRPWNPIFCVPVATRIARQYRILFGNAPCFVWHAKDSLCCALAQALASNERLDTSCFERDDFCQWSEPHAPTAALLANQSETLGIIVLDSENFDLAQQALALTEAEQMVYLRNGDGFFMDLEMGEMRLFILPEE